MGAHSLPLVPKKPFQACPPVRPGPISRVPGLSLLTGNVAPQTALGWLQRAPPEPGPRPCSCTHLATANTVPGVPEGPKSCRVRKTTWSWCSAWLGSWRCWECAQRHTCSRLREGFPRSIRLRDCGGQARQQRGDSQSPQTAAGTLTPSHRQRTPRPMRLQGRSAGHQ